MSRETTDKATTTTVRYLDEEEVANVFRRARRVTRKLKQAADPEPVLPESSSFAVVKLPMTIEKLLPIALRGSSTAKRVLQSAILCRNGWKALSDGDLEKFITIFAEVYRKEHRVVVWTTSDLCFFLQKMNNFLKFPYTSRRDADVLFVLAHGFFADRAFKHCLGAIETACCLIPDDGNFYYLKGCALAAVDNQPAATEAFEKCTSLGCSDIERTLCDRALFYTKDFETRVRLLEDYVAQAEPDALNLSEACYTLALCNGLVGPRYMGQAKMLFSIGQEADKLRFDFLPDEAATIREQAHDLLKRYKMCANPACNDCGYNSCSACQKVVYCSHDCQKQHWKEHKKFCRNNRSIHSSAK